jgi:hypothetical protein
MVQRQSRPWSNPKVLGILAFIFLCGAAVGSAVTRTYLHERMMTSTRAIEIARRIGVKRLKTELGLRPEQEQGIVTILDDYGKYYQNLEEDREDVARHGKEHIVALLTPDQQKRFDEMLSQAVRE